MQKTQWWNRTSCWKFWWLDCSRSQGPQWQLRISKQSPICSRGAGSSHSMDPSRRIRAKTKLHKTQRSLQKILEPERNPKVIYTDNSLEFGKACEDLSWNHCTSTPHRSETNGIAERAVRRVQEGTSAVFLQSGLNESWWADSMECYTYLRNVTDLLSDGKTPWERRFGQPFKGPIIPFGSFGWVSPYNCEGSVKNPSIWKESLTWIVPRIRSAADIGYEPKFCVDANDEYTPINLPDSNRIFPSILRSIQQQACIQPQRAEFPLC